MNLKFSIKEMSTAAIFTAITAILAQISIPLPFTPVPITMQVFAVYLSAIILGGRLGALSQLIYLLLGGIGIPVFANFSGGFQILAGPNGGYLLSYPIIAYLIGKISEKDSNHILSIAELMGTLVMCYAAGTIQFHFVTNISIQKAIFLCVLPFIPLDIIKVVVAYIAGCKIKGSLLRAKLIKL
ncbi:biotin transporter BioY [Clostridium sp. MT-14]|mgnify:CR=1 FL=1|uniref:Biotin transporter n=1 Tax=Clostridium aromativorans TaxID=2836848 RepID=A0ABS8N5Q7_9CLOT|nr:MULTISPECIES: biotin transporter BioY [Clostridium]KAA8671792.1 biotin transporter BioY [Clostridium sp. HV4-5-A1G]MCC9295006.1 biotin transporter BioY [Clostridium aromativorans]CAB1239177.1 Biotin transporter BioY [Clostridiaceae bacterium BL-3]